MYTYCEEFQWSVAVVEVQAFEGGLYCFAGAEAVLVAFHH
jgi:hypothetical protein